MRAAHLGNLTLLVLLLAAPAAGQLGYDDAQLLIPAQDGLAGTEEPGDHFGGAVAAGDFDGDGRDDLAVAATDETPSGSASWAGEVTVVYGSDGGLEPSSGELWSLDDTSFGPAGEFEHFGEALAAGDFDGDGFEDLAIGIPDRDVSGQEDAGFLVVLYGDSGGLGFFGHQGFRPGAGGVDGALEPTDWFGEELAAGDFNGDGRDDLAIGAPGENFGDHTENIGAVHVIYGSAAGLSTDAVRADQMWTQGDTEVGETQEHAVFGRALAAGDFDRDGFVDLAIGSPQADVGEEQGAGWVTILYGSAEGLAEADAQLFDQSGAVPGEPDFGAHFGAALVAADFDFDGDDDLAIGVPLAERTVADATVANAGVAVVLDGGSGGLTTSAPFLIDRLEAGAAPAADDELGSALTAGRFGGGPAQLAVGAPGVLVDGDDEAGLAYVFSGFVGGGPQLELAPSQSAGPGSPEVDDHFGTFLAAGDFDGDGFDDLAVGVPEENSSGHTNAGVVNVFYSEGLFRDDFESADVDRWSDDVSD